MIVLLPTHYGKLLSMAELVSTERELKNGTLVFRPHGCTDYRIKLYTKTGVLRGHNMAPAYFTKHGTPYRIVQTPFRSADAIVEKAIAVMKRRAERGIYY